MNEGGWMYRCLDVCDCVYVIECGWVKLFAGEVLNVCECVDVN